MVTIGELDLDTGPGIVAAIGSNPVAAARRARSMGAHILEVRIDLLGIRDTETLDRLLDELKAQAGLPLIVTNRCAREGGQWEGSESDRMQLLISALPGADAVDVELFAPQRDRVIAAAKQAGRTLIISSHDFTATPPLDTMLDTLRTAKAKGADIPKLAVTPHSSTDTLRLLQATRQAEFPVCTIAMGRLGSHTRVVAPIYGSVLTYGTVDQAVAPGQLRIDELKTMLEALL